MGLYSHFTQYNWIYILLLGLVCMLAKAMMWIPEYQRTPNYTFTRKSVKCKLSTRLCALQNGKKRLADSEPRLQQRSVHLSLTLRRITHQYEDSIYHSV